MERLSGAARSIGQAKKHNWHLLPLLTFIRKCVNMTEIDFFREVSRLQLATLLYTEADLRARSSSSTNVRNPKETLQSKP